MPPEQSTSGPLVGRADELTALAGLIGLGSAEPGGAVLLSGDAGVGKTRLLAELRDRARDAGWRVLVGHCLDFGDSALPYLPFSEAFGRLAADSPALAESLVEARPAVARLMPRRRMLGDDGPAQAERTDRADLFEAVHAALEQLGQTGPLLLLVEDVHWADQSTREMLSFLFARQFSGPVSAVASYRTDDLHRRHPLRTVAAEWARLPGVSRVQLRPLPDKDVRSLVRVLHPAPMPERDIRHIVDRAEGNAFFTEELVAAAGLGARSLPDDLADLLLVRLDQLDDATRLVVRAAAVAGRRVSHDLLAHVVEVDGATLDGALRSAVENNVLVPLGADSYAFRHALLAEAVYDDLLPGERVRLHAAYAGALTARDVDGTAAELARHARAAHDLATAIRASIQAGDEAMAVGGPDEAAHHYETALELLGDRDLAAAGDGPPVDVVDLVLCASEAAEHAGHLFRALALVEDQLRALPADTPAPQRARLLLALAEGSLYSDTAIDGLALTTEAMRLVPAEPATPLRAQVLSMHARSSADRQRDDDAARWATKALGLARELGLPDVAADAATTLARLDERAGDPDSSRQTLEQTVAQARAAGEVAAELRGLFNLAMLHFELGELADARARFEEAAGRARQVGRPWAPYGFDGRGLAGMVAYVAGDWTAATRIVDVTDETPPGLAEAVLAAIDMSVAAGRGKRQALELMPHLRPWWDREGMVAIHSGSAAIDLYGDGGDLAAAEAIHDDVVGTVSELWQQPDFQARIRLAALLLGQLGTEATRAGARERADLARRGDELAEAVAQVAEQGRFSGRRRGPEGEAWLARVAAEHARLRWLTAVEPPGEDELVAVWERAVDGFDRFGHVFELARSRARLAAVLRAVGRADDAAKPGALAREVARRLGAEPLLAELRVLGRGVPAPRSEASRRDEALTMREEEVLALVAQGRSNREIAGQLFISAKTVSVHVSNILAKLGAGGRTEAVAVARRRGLLVDERA